jgi:hypothetical protein
MRFTFKAGYLNEESKTRLHQLKLIIQLAYLKNKTNVLSKKNPIFRKDFLKPK